MPLLPHLLALPPAPARAALRCACAPGRARSRHAWPWHARIETVAPIIAIVDVELNFGRLHAYCHHPRMRLELRITEDQTAPRMVAGGERTVIADILCLTGVKPLTWPAN